MKVVISFVYIYFLVVSALNLECHKIKFGNLNLLCNLLVIQEPNFHLFDRLEYLYVFLENRTDPRRNNLFLIPTKLCLLFRLEMICKQFRNCYDQFWVVFDILFYIFLHLFFSKKIIVKRTFLSLFIKKAQQFSKYNFRRLYQSNVKALSIKFLFKLLYKKKAKISIIFFKV